MKREIIVNALNAVLCSVAMMSGSLPAASRAAIDFDAGDSLQWTPPVSGAPLTIVAWTNTDSASGVRYAVTLVNSASSLDESYSLRTNGTLSQCRQASGGVSGISIAPNGVAINTWEHMAGMFATSSRTAARNGSADATPDSTTVAAPTIAKFFAGMGWSIDLAEVAVFDRVIGAGELALLQVYKPIGFNPVFYCSGVSSTTAEIGGAPAPTGTPTISTHPNILFPPWLVLSPAGM